MILNKYYCFAKLNLNYIPVAVKIKRFFKLRINTVYTDVVRKFEENDLNTQYISDALSSLCTNSVCAPSHNDSKTILHA